MLHPRNARSSRSAVPHTVDDASLVQGGEATPIYEATIIRQRQEPDVENHESSDEGTSQSEDTQVSPWWREHRTYILWFLESWL